MPTIIQVPLTNNEQKIYYHEPNRRIRTIDLNTLSGASLGDSNLEMLIKISKAITGNFDPATNTYLGFKVATYTSTTISTLLGNVISNDGLNDGVYSLPPLSLVPNSGAWWGFYELEFVQTTADPIGLDFFDGVVGSFASSPTRKVFQINVYENFNNTSSYPTLTPGRIKWIEYKRSGASPADVIVFVNNLITQNQTSVFGFKTGDPKYSLKAGDNIDWVTCTGYVLPNTYIDLISYLRSVTINSTPINFPSCDNNLGLLRLTITGGTNLKNVRFGLDPKYSCVTILNSSGSLSPLPNGVYKINDIVGNQITLQVAWSSSFTGGTGDIDLLPFANEDNAGGGARTPFPDFIRGFNPFGSSNDVLRLVNTYQDSQVENHTHINTISSSSAISGSATFPITGSTSGSGNLSLRGFATAGNGGDLPLAGATGGTLNVPVHQINVVSYNSNNGDEMQLYIPAHGHTIAGSVVVDASSFSLSSSVSITNNPYGGQDTDNPNTTRPDNLTMYLLLKT